LHGNRREQCCVSSFRKFKLQSKVVSHPVHVSLSELIKIMHEPVSRDFLNHAMLGDVRVENHVRPQSIEELISPALLFFLVLDNAVADACHLELHRENNQ
jgi:hypothetical protein